MTLRTTTPTPNEKSPALLPGPSNLERPPRERGGALHQALLMLLAASLPRSVTTS